MAKRKQRRRRREPVPTSEYRDADGNVLTLRRELSPGTIRKLAEPPASAAVPATAAGILASAAIAADLRKAGRILAERAAG